MRIYSVCFGTWVRFTDADQTFRTVFRTFRAFFGFGRYSGFSSFGPVRMSLQELEWAASFLKLPSHDQQRMGATHKLLLLRTDSQEEKELEMADQ